MLGIFRTLIYRFLLVNICIYSERQKITEKGHIQTSHRQMAYKKMHLPNEDDRIPSNKSFSTYKDTPSSGKKMPLRLPCNDKPTFQDEIQQWTTRRTKKFSLLSSQSFMIDHILDAKQHMLQHMMKNTISSSTSSLCLTFSVSA